MKEVEERLTREQLIERARREERGKLRSFAASRLKLARLRKGATWFGYAEAMADMIAELEEQS